MKTGMTRNEVIQAAHKVATKSGWPWEEPLLVEQGRRFLLFGKRYWLVTTNFKYAAIGRNVYVQIDDESGQVLSSKYVPKYQGVLSTEDPESTTPGRNDADAHEVSAAMSLAA